MKRRIFILFFALTVAARVGSAADPPPSTTQFAHELYHLKQVDLIKAQAAAAAGTPQESLWKAQSLLVQFDALTKDKMDASRVAEEYLAALRATLAATQTRDTPVDGAWALDHAQLILTRIAQPVLTRMEYFSPTKRDRGQLAPLATLADELLTASSASYERDLKALESAKPFDQKTYMIAYAGAAEGRYYAAWALYFRAMALDPAGTPEERRKLLAKAAEALAEWAVDDADNGVNFQSYLLRGKVYAEAGDYAKAFADFDKAGNAKAPEWVQYQSQYQSVVTQLRSGNMVRTRTALENFRRGIPRENVEAQLSADLLAYRVAWASAEAITDPEDRARAQRAAMDMLADIIQKDPRFRDLVFEMLATQLPEEINIAKLLPLQQLSVAYINSRGQTGQSGESKMQLATALAAAHAARDNIASRRSEKLEAIFLSGVCNALLGNLMEAATDEIDFAEQASRDPRARPLLEVALRQIGELRKAAAADNRAVDPVLTSLANRALQLAADTFHDEQWLYTQGRLLEETGKNAEAMQVYARIGTQDRNYFEARYRLVVIAADKFTQATAPKSQATPAEVLAAANDLFKVCSTFTALLEKSPASVPAETLDAAKAYRSNIWLIEAATALHAGVRQPEIAIDRLNRLDAAKDQLNEQQRLLALRYRIQANQLAGKPDETRKVVAEYIKANPANAMNDLRGMALSTVDEIDKVEAVDPARAKRLAANVVELLQPIIEAAGNEGEKKETAYEYRLIQAEMMGRAGMYKESQVLAVALQDERREDIRPYLTEARAMFAQAQSAGDRGGYARAQEYFTRILANRAPGSEIYWECWLRIVLAMEGQNAATAPSEIKKRLGDLKGIYGTKFGGERYKAEFDRLAKKYDIP